MPDIYGNPTEAELRGQAYTPTNYLMTPEIRAAIAARNSSSISTRAVGNPDGTVTYEERATPRRNNSPNAQNFQSAFADDPYYSRSDIAPAIQGTNRDLMGNGRFGVRGWLRDHPVGTIAAFIAAAAGGAALAPGAGGAGTAAGTAGGSATSGFSALAPSTAAGTGTGLGTSAAGGLQASSGLGIFGGGGTAGLAGVGGGNAGALAASGAIAGGAGIGGTTAGSLGGLSRAANAVSGVGGGSMGWWDNVLDLLPIAGSLYNSSQQRDAAGDASSAQIAAQREAIAEQRRQFDTQLEMLRPQRELGNSAINVLGRLGGYNTGADGGAGAPDMSAFYASPDYNFRRTEGNRDIGNSFAARGGALSGNALRGITDYNSNLASGEFNNFVQRRLQEAGLGGAATSQGVNASQYTGGNVSNLLAEGGNARASGIINQSNAVTNGLNDIGGWYGNWLRNRRVG